MKWCNPYKSQDLWDIALYVDGCLHKVFSPKNIIRTKYHQITGYADPFLFIKDDFLYLFYEREHLLAPAPIYGYRTKDLQSWEKLGLVLQETFHLSYPCVFQAEGQIYMTPECRSTNSVRLYRAEKFPNQWTPITILEGDKYVDSSLFFQDGIWYLFTTKWDGEDTSTNELQLYTASQIEGPYCKHPSSPIDMDLKSCRCGGSIVNIDGTLYRPAQDCSEKYGGDVVLYQIDILSPKQYAEHKVKSLIDRNQTWSPYGGHQYNRTYFNGHLVEVYDGIIQDNWINNHTRKLFNWIHRKLQ